jgi:hypothetical protein
LTCACRCSGRRPSSMQLPQLLALGSRADASRGRALLHILARGAGPAHRCSSCLRKQLLHPPTPNPPSPDTPGPPPPCAGRSDGKGRYWFLNPWSANTVASNATKTNCNAPPGVLCLNYTRTDAFAASPVYAVKYKLPQGFTCDKCTLHWWAAGCRQRAGAGAPGPPDWAGPKGLMFLLLDL